MSSTDSNTSIGSKGRSSTGGDAYEFLIKLLIIGAAGSGKSCLLHRFLEASFRDYSYHTIGVEFGSRIVNVCGRSIKLQIWDTAGQERFRSVTRSYYRGAAGALLVFDISNLESFHSLTGWLNDARSLAGHNIAIVLVGHKSDLEAERQVPQFLAEQFAEDNDVEYIEASSLTGHCAELTFMNCAKSILERIDIGEIDPLLASSGVQQGQLSLQQRPDVSSSSTGSNSVFTPATSSSCFECN